MAILHFSALVDFPLKNRFCFCFINILVSKPNQHAADYVAVLSTVTSYQHFCCYQFHYKWAAQDFTLLQSVHSISD